MKYNVINKKYDEILDALVKMEMSLEGETPDLNKALAIEPEGKTYTFDFMGTAPTLQGGDIIVATRHGWSWRELEGCSSPLDRDTLCSYAEKGGIPPEELEAAWNADEVEEKYPAIYEEIKECAIGEYIAEVEDAAAEEIGLLLDEEDI